MNNFLAFLAVFLPLSSFAADLNPADAVQSLLSDVDQDQIHNLVPLLSGQALKSFGNPQGMETLQRAFSEMTLEVGEATPDRAGAVSFPVYLQGAPSDVVFTATVDCKPAKCQVEEIYFE